MPGPMDRLRGRSDAQAALDTLSSTLSGRDVRSALLYVAAQRASRQSPSRVLAQHQNDRFCVPAPVDALAIATAEASSLHAVAATFHPVQLSPLSPLATSSALSAVPQNNVVTTMRLTEVVSDPTNVLALEAALARRDDPTTTVRYSTAHRVVRAQRFKGPKSFAHFSILGLVSAGRDHGGRAFEIAELVRHIGSMTAAIRSIDSSATVVARVSDHSGRLDEAHAIVEALEIEANVDTSRAHGIGYYPHLCCKLDVRYGDKVVEVADAGCTDWTAQLLADKKERLVISGIGLDRLIMGRG